MRMPSSSRVTSKVGWRQVSHIAKRFRHALEILADEFAGSGPACLGRAHPAPGPAPTRGLSVGL